MRKTRLAFIALLCAIALVLAGCGQSSDDSATESTEATETTAATEATDAAEATDATDAATSTAPTDGTYDIEVDTDSSMFRAEYCTLKVEDGTYTAILSLPGEGFSRLYYGTAEEAASASDDDIYDYYLNDDGKYTFDIPVAALDEELTIAAFGQRRDTWYDHTITFHAPDAA